MSTGVQDQHLLNRVTAERHGWTVVHEFTDNDKSAVKAVVIRDEFEDMLRVLRSGKLADGTSVRGALVVADDRLARRPGDYERFVEAITYQDGRVYAVDANAYFARPGPRVVTGIELLAHLLHPDVVAWRGPSDAFQRCDIGTHAMG